MKLIKTILLSLMTLSLCVPAWATSVTCLVVPAGTPGNTPTSPYNSLATAANLISACVAYCQTQTPTGTGVGQGHNIYVSAENASSVTYVDHNNVHNNNMSGATIMGVVNVATKTPAAYGQVFMSNTSTILDIYTEFNLTVSHMSFTGTNSSSDLLVFESAGDVADHDYFYDSGRYLLVMRAGATGVTIQDCKGLGAASTVAAIELLSGSSGSINTSIFTNSPDMPLGIGTSSAVIVNRNTSTDANWYLNNSLLMGSDGTAIKQVGTGTIIANNDILQAGCAGSGIYTVAQSAGTVIVNNSLLFASYRNSGTGTAQYFSGIVGDSNNIFSGTWAPVRRARSGFILPCVDDSNYVAYGGQVSDILASYGVRGTFFADAYNALYDSNDGNPATLQALATRNGGNMEIGLHAWDDSDLTVANGTTLFNITGGTVTVNRKTGLISTSNSGSNTYSFKGQFLYSIVQWLQQSAGSGGGGVTVTSTSAYSSGGGGPGQISASTLGECLADSGGTTTTIKLLNVDETAGLLKTEVPDAKTALQNLMGFPVTDFCAPNGITSRALESAVFNSGFSSLRPLYGASGYIDNHLLTNFNLYRINAFTASNLIRANDAATLQNCRILFELAAQTGGVVPILSHKQSEISTHNWDLILSLAQSEYPELTITNFSTAVAAIKSSPWVDTSNTQCADSATPYSCCTGSGTGTCTGINFSRTSWGDEGSNYALKSISSAINAGTNTPWTGVANVTDFAGTAITDGSGAIVAPGGIVDIGAYEYIDGNGVCGSNNNAQFYTLSSGDPHNCSAGIETNFTGSGPWTWYCAGSNGGKDSGTCAANLPPPIVINADAATTFSATGGLGTYAWSIVGSPPWLTITGSGKGNSIGTITLTGLPANGPATVQVTDGYSSASITETFTIVVSAPGAPTGVTATAGNGQAAVSFTPPVSDGGGSITSYTVTSNPGSITATGSSSTITVTGLTNDTAYTFTVIATNAIGDGSPSAPSNSVTPSMMSQPTPVPAAFPIPLAGAGLVLFMLLRRRAKKQLSS